MARNMIGNAPFPVRTLEQDKPLTITKITELIKSSGGAVTLCLRSEHGDPNRGGYFFHMQAMPEERKYKIFDFEKNEIACLEANLLIRFVNHVSGRQFDPEVHLYCQHTVNLRLDQINAGTEV